MSERDTEDNHGATLTGQTRAMDCDYCGTEKHALREDGSAECTACGRVQK